MSSSRHVSRHARARRVRSLPSPSVSGAARNAAKSLAGVGIVLGSGAFIIAPTSAVGAGSAAHAPSLTASADTSDALFAQRDASTRGSSRSARATASAAVTAPAAKGAGAELDTGALGIEAVAKPKPKPKPKPVKKSEPTSSPTKAREASDQPSAVPEARTATPTTQASSAPTKAPEATPAEPAQPPTATAAPTRSGSSAGDSSSGGSSSGGSSVETGNYASQGAAIGLGANGQQVYSAVRTQFPSMSNIGGYRAGDAGDHGSGRAVDIMTGSGDGDAVAAYLQQHAGELNITYVIWKQRIWTPGGSWTPMADRGDPTQNHFDHVHVSVN